MGDETMDFFEVLAADQRALLGVGLSGVADAEGLGVADQRGTNVIEERGAG